MADETFWTATAMFVGFGSFAAGMLILTSISVFMAFRYAKKRRAALDAKWFQR